MHSVAPDRAQVLMAEEKKTLLERYKVKDSQLPRIQFNDPVARYYGMQKGQVRRYALPFFFFFFLVILHPVMSLKPYVALARRDDR